jgi:DNA-binding response OmpR family regulator
MMPKEEDLKKAPILVVEDTAMIRVLLTRHLKTAGFTNVLEANDGQQALEVLAKEPVELVLLDINMPVLDGYGTLEKIKADPSLKDLTVIMVTAVDKIESVAQCIQMGASDYMPKLFNPILLNARILSCLEKRWLQKELLRLWAGTEVS